MNPLETAQSKRSTKTNKVETTKALKDPMEVYARLEAIAQGGYDALPKEDAAYFLKCFGLFDKGEDFMLRVRVPVGQLSAPQAIRIGELARDYGADYIDLTTRMQIVLRYLPIEQIATVVHALREVGLSTFQTGVDNPRNIVADPLDGVAYDSIIPTRPIVDRIQEQLIENPDWISTLPRKFNTGILGSLSNSCNIYGHDCAFVLANREGEYGFNVYLGARVGVQASDIDLFVTAGEVPHFLLTLLELFKTYGYRDNRNKNRLHFLLRDVGIAPFAAALREAAGIDYPSAGQTLVQSEAIVPGSDKVLLRDGTYAARLIVPSGVFRGTDLIALAVAAQAHGSGELRLSYDQNLYALHIPHANLKPFSAETIVQRYAPYRSVYFTDMIACAGTKTCAFGVIPNKPDAVALAEFLQNEVPLRGGQVRMNWSACPKGCGVHGIADIGFEGCRARDTSGDLVDGVHIYLGGKITRTAREARQLHKALPLPEARHHVKYLLHAYAQFRQRGESFEAFEDRYLSRNYSYQALAFYTRINYILGVVLTLDIHLDLEAEPRTYRKENFEIFHFGMRLFRLLTGEKRYVETQDFEPILIQPRRIRRDEVTRLNPAVPAVLSEVIYRMTDADRKNRAAVFSELLVTLKEL